MIQVGQKLRNFIVTIKFKVLHLESKQISLPQILKILSHLPFQVGILIQAKISIKCPFITKFLTKGQKTILRLKSKIQNKSQMLIWSNLILIKDK